MVLFDQSLCQKRFPRVGCARDQNNHNQSLSSLFTLSKSQRFRINTRNSSMPLSHLLTATAPYTPFFFILKAFARAIGLRTIRPRARLVRDAQTARLYYGSLFYFGTRLCACSAYGLRGCSISYAHHIYFTHLERDAQTARLLRLAYLFIGLSAFADTPSCRPLCVAAHTRAA